MPFLTPQQRSFLTAVSQLVYANPFLPERVEFERAALGDAFVAGEPVWSQHVHDPEQPRANVWRIVERLEALAEQLQARLGEGVEGRPADLVLYEDAVLHLLYQRYYRHFFAAAFGPAAAQSDPARWRFYNNFLADWRRFFHIDAVRLPTGHDPRHTFACFRQIQCAFEQVFRDIIGSSIPSALPRAALPAPASARSSPPSSRCPATSSAAPCRPPACAPPSGSPSSPTISAATAARSTRAWASSPPSSRDRPAPARNWWPAPSRNPATSPSTIGGSPSPTTAGSSPSISPPSRPPWSSRNCSAIAGAPSQAR